MVNGRFYLVDSSAYWRASRANNKLPSWGAAYAQIQVPKTLKPTRGRYNLFTYLLLSRPGGADPHLKDCLR